MKKNNIDNFPNEYMLTDAEKITLRESVFSYIESPKEVLLPSPFFVPRKTLFLNQTFFAAFSFASLVFLFTSGAIASGAKPGEILYPFKIHINEKFLTLVSFGDKAKAETHLVLAERRIAEIENLALQKNTDLETLSLLSLNFKSQADGVNKYVEDLKNDGHLQDASNVSGSFEAKIDAHKKILMEISKVNTETKEFISPVLGSLDNQNELVEKKQDEINLKVTKNFNETKVKTDTENESVKNRTQITEVKTRIKKERDENGALNLETEERKLFRAEQLLDAGKIEIEKQNFPDAFIKQQKASKEIEEASTLIQAKIDLGLHTKIEGDEEGAIEEILEEIKGDEAKFEPLKFFLKD